MKFYTFSHIAGLVLGLAAVGCSSSTPARYEEGTVRPGPAEISAERLPFASAPAPLFPWETWSMDRDLGGQPLQSPLIKQGDSYVREGLRGRALESYRTAESGPLSREETEALVLRIASTQLGLDRPKEALRTLSDYFRKSNRSVDDVASPFSLIFGFAYGRAADAEQSLAWFARSARVATHDIASRESAERGARLVLSGLSEDQIVPLAELWSSDPFIRTLVGEERARRAAGGVVRANGSFDIWTENTSVIATSIPSESDLVKVGVLLPLSGKYSALGRATRNGMELAILSQQDPVREDGLPPAIQLVFRDSGSSVPEAVGQGEKLISTDGAKVVVGPLISEQALSVKEIAQRLNVPLVALAKNASFPTGDTVYRLGATVRSQVRSLVEIGRSTVGISRVALVYPGDAAGIEFAEVFRSEAAQAGMQIVYESAYQRGESGSFVTIAKETESSRAQGVFFPDGIGLASRFFANFSPEGRARIRPLGVANWDNPQQLANSSTVLNGAVFVSPFFATGQRPTVQRFVETYRARYGQSPDFLAAQGFDAATLVQAIVRRQQLDQSSWQAAALGLEPYEGLTGRIVVRSDGELERQFVVAQLGGGEITELERQSSPIISADSTSDQTYR